MRIIKLIIISCVILFGVLLVMSLFIPSHVRISRAININASDTHINKQIQDLRHWKKWNELVKQNGSFEQSAFRSEDINISIVSNTAGTINTKWKQSKRVEILSSFRVVEISDKMCAVQWYFDFYQKWYPWEKFGSILFDKQLGPSMEKSLDNLKKLLENSP